jgi:thioredoxin-like negative regulator of GroEL
MMEASFASPTVQEIVDSHFSVVNVDIDKNPGTAKQYQINTIPRVIVFDANGEVHADHVGGLEPDELRAFLQDSMVQIGVPSGIHPDLTAPLKSANDAGKKLLVDFRGDWNDIWEQLDEVRADPSVKAMLDKDFYYYKLDIGHFDKHMGCADRYKVKRIPTVVAFNKEGEPIARYEHSPDAASLKAFLQSVLAPPRRVTKGLVVYRLEDIACGKDAVGAAIAKAGTDGRKLIVYFYAKNTKEHTAIETAIGDSAKNSVMDGYALVRMDAASNAEVAKKYGCMKAPCVVVFDAKGKAAKRFDKPMTGKELVAALGK